MNKIVLLSLFIGVSNLSAALGNGPVENPTRRSTDTPTITRTGLKGPAEDLSSIIIAPNGQLHDEFADITYIIQLTDTGSGRTERHVVFPAYLLEQATRAYAQLRIPSRPWRHMEKSSPTARFRIDLVDPNASIHRRQHQGILARRGTDATVLASPERSAAARALMQLRDSGK